MGFLQTIVRRLGFRKNSDLRKIARQVDGLAKEHQRFPRRDPQDVANNFFSRRLKEANDIRTEIIFIRSVRKKFKATREVSMEKLEIEKRKLVEIENTVNKTQSTIRNLAYTEEKLTFYENASESIEEEIDELLELRKKRTKEINQLISARKNLNDTKLKLEFAAFVSDLQKRLDFARNRLRAKVMEKNYYGVISIKELQQQKIGTLEILEEAMDKKLSLERDIFKLESRIARMTIYIQGTYDYTRRLYLMESGADSGALALVEPSNEGGLSVVK